jgi:dTDP-4-amino-4,6-dideoxygalactose transaminase
MSLPDVPHSRPSLDERDHEAVARVMRRGMIAAGEETRAFEVEVGRSLGMPPGVATPTGTRALACALEALGIGAGDDVVIPTYVCRAVADAVRGVGATPRLCDVGDDWCATPDTIAAAVGPRTRAIVVVHTFGIAADVAGLRRFGLPVIEDCCQALGAPGTARDGDVTILSFHATKLLTTGEGGMALTRDAALGARIRAIAASARQPLSDLQAALGRAQLARYGDFVAKRKALALRYLADLTGLALAAPAHLTGRSVFFRLPVRIAGDFDEVRGAFAARGVQVRRGVDALLHRSEGIAGRFDGAEQRFAETVSLPIYPSLQDDEYARVVAACRDVFAAVAKRQA